MTSVVSEQDKILSKKCKPKGSFYISEAFFTANLEERDV